MTFMEMDNCFIRAIRYLHSSSNESQNNIRILLDEAIKSKYGPGKELSLFLNFTTDFASIQEYPVANMLTTLENKDGLKTASSSDNELELDLLKEDLMCVVCKGMGVGARNRLVECSDCHNLYHQECHDPSISEEESEAGATWICATCKDIHATKPLRKSLLNTQTSSISTHKSNSQHYMSSKYNEKDYSEVSSKSVGTRSSPGSSLASKSNSVPNRIITPNINLVSADRRLQIMKKKAAKMQEKRKLSR